MFTFNIVSKKVGNNYFGIENSISIMDIDLNKHVVFKDFLELYWKYLDYDIVKDNYETLDGKAREIFLSYYELSKSFYKFGVSSFLVVASTKPIISFYDYNFTFVGIDLLSADLSESLLKGMDDENLNSFGLCQSMEAAKELLQKYNSETQAYFPCWTYCLRCQ